jgi:hypothetical protein
VGVFFREEAPILAHSEFCRFSIGVEIVCNKVLSLVGFISSDEPVVTS